MCITSDKYFYFICVAFLRHYSNVWFTSCSGLIQGWIVFESQEFAWNQTLFRRPQTGCFGLHPNVIALFSPAQTNHTKGEDTTGFDLNGLNAAYVKAPLEASCYQSFSINCLIAICAKSFNVLFTKMMQFKLQSGFERCVCWSRQYGWADLGSRTYRFTWTLMHAVLSFHAYLY